MKYYNYRGLSYKDSFKRFKRDYSLKYKLYGQFTKWRTKFGDRIRVKDLNRIHLIYIVEKFGNTYIRTNYPFIWYRYLKEVIENE